MATDESTRKTGGDLLFVDARSQVRKPLLDAILALTPLAQVQITIRRKLAQAAQARDVEAFLDKLRKSTRVETFPENLAKVEPKAKPAPRSVAEHRAEKPGTDRVSSLVP